MNKFSILITSITAIILVGCSEKKPLTLANSSVDRIVVSMTLEEKLHLLSDTDPLDITTTHPIARLGIPSIAMADGSNHTTTFPIPPLMAATWNTELITSVGEAMGREVLEYGIDVLLAPELYINRNPLDMQNINSFSEDPILSGLMAAAMVNGIQSNGVGASLKYFAVNDRRKDIRLTPRALREIYLKPFEIAVKESQPWAISTSDNHINGIQSSESTGLLRTVLRNEWRYDGMVMAGSISRNMVDPIRTGTDLPMPAYPEEYDNILAAVNNGTLKMTDINRNVTNILKLIAKTPRTKGRSSADTLDLEAHGRISSQAAAEGMVLLKNDRQTLPLNSGVKLATFEPHDLWLKPGLLAEQVRTSDVALFNIWPHRNEEGDIESSGDFKLYDHERRDIQTICNAYHAMGKKVIVVLHTETPIETASWKDLPDAILLAWRPVQELENTVTDVLYGKTNPSGKLPMTFPVNYMDVPSSANYFSDSDYAVYTEDIYVGYRYFDSFRKKVSYPFGYGLSYTTFKYENESIQEEKDHFIVTVDVINTGVYSGKEVVQLYVSAPINLSLPKPLKELKAFAKSKELTPGERQTLTMRVNKKDLASFKEEESKWIVDRGNYKFLLGSSSEDIRLFVDGKISESIEMSVNNVLLPREPIIVLAP